MFGYDAETVGGGLPVLVASPAKALCENAESAEKPSAENAE